MSLFKREEPELKITQEEKMNRLGFIFGEATENNYNSQNLQPNSEPVGNEKLYKVISEAEKEQYQNQINNQYYNKGHYGYYNNQHYNNGHYGYYNNQYYNNGYYDNQNYQPVPVSEYNYSETADREQIGFDRSGYLKSINRNIDVVNEEEPVNVPLETNIPVEDYSSYYETVDEEEYKQQFPNTYQMPVTENNSSAIYAPEVNTPIYNSPAPTIPVYNAPATTYELTEEEKREKLLMEWKQEEERIKQRKEIEAQKEEQYKKNIEILNETEKQELVQTIEPEQKQKLSEKEIKEQERLKRIEERQIKAAYKKALRIEKQEARKGRFAYKGE